MEQIIKCILRNLYYDIHLLSQYCSTFILKRNYVAIATTNVIIFTLFPLKCNLVSSYKEEKSGIPTKIVIYNAISI